MEGYARPVSLSSTVMRHRRLDFHAMASPCEVQLWHADDDTASEALRAARDEVLRIEAKYSRYRDDSVIGTINRAAGGEAVEVDAETAALLDFAARCHADSGGRFDITSGVLRRAWNFRDGVVPDAGVIESLLPMIGWPQVEWRRPHIRLPRAGMELDFGGFGKEYAADRAAAMLVEHRIRHGLVNLGGDVRAIGPHPERQPWHIAIQHPRQPDTLIAEIAIGDGALATSGDYERYFERDGRRYCHVLDATTGWPIQGAQSVSVLAPLCIVAGVHATVAMLHGHQAQGYLAATGLPHLLVDGAGRVSGHLAPAPPSAPLPL